MEHVDPTAARLRIGWGATLAALLLATWPLWTPLRQPPRVPPVAALAGIPPAADFALLALLALGVARATFGRYSTALATAALAGLMAVDQLRWQPWAYHALLLGGVLAACRPRRALALGRLLAASVYLYSALAKLDATYARTLGRQLVDASLRPFGVGHASLPDLVGEALVFAPPVIELAIGVLLATSLRWRTLRRPAAGAAAAMHAATVALLGPWGLDHSAGVLLWNVGFAWQTWALFWPTAAPPPSTATAATTLRERLATAAILFAAVAPLSAPLGWWDRWPSWGLYAPGGERAALFVHRSVADRLPDPLRPPDEPPEAWRRVRIDRWVLETTGAPIYPQNRVRLALAAALAERYPVGDRVRVIVESRADRFTGQRDSRELEGAAALRGEASWLAAPLEAAWTE